MFFGWYCGFLIMGGSLIVCFCVSGVLNICVFSLFLLWLLNIIKFLFCWNLGFWFCFFIYLFNEGCVGSLVLLMSVWFWGLNIVMFIFWNVGLDFLLLFVLCKCLFRELCFRDLVGMWELVVVVFLFFSFFLFLVFVWCWLLLGVVLLMCWLFLLLWFGFEWLFLFFFWFVCECLFFILLGFFVIVFDVNVFLFFFLSDLVFDGFWFFDLCFWVFGGFLFGCCLVYEL